MVEKKTAKRNAGTFCFAAKKNAAQPIRLYSYETRTESIILQPKQRNPQPLILYRNQTD